MTTQHIGTLLDEKITWCGVPLLESEIVFKDAETAAIAGKMDSEIYTCNKCVNEIIKCLYKN